MAADSEIIKSFLVSLGFKVDETGNKKFDDALEKTGKFAFAAGTALVGVSIAAQKMVSVFSAEMEKLYYASQRTGASVENLQALESGAQRIGLKAGQATSALEAMSTAIRLNPGIEGLLGKFGVKSEGVDKAVVLINLLKQLQKLPYYQGAKFAQLFGMDEQTFFMMTQGGGLQKLEEAEAKRIKLNRDAGINADEAAKASKDYENALRDLGDASSVLSMKIVTYLQPAFSSIIKSSNEAVKALIKFSNGDFSGMGEFQSQLEEIAKDLKEITGSGITSFINQFFSAINTGIKDSIHQLLDLIDGLLKLKNGDFKGAASKFWDAIKLSDTGQSVSNIISGGKQEWTREKNSLNGTSTQTNSNGTSTQTNSSLPLAFNTNAITLPQTQSSSGQTASFSGNKNQFLKNLEKQYSLPAGLLDAVWNAESGRGRVGVNKENSAHAMGDFQFIPSTAKAYGITDRSDFKQEAAAAAKYYARLLKKYNGDINKAAAAYNWSETKTDRGLGYPKETRDYQEKIHRTMQQTNNITVNGTKDPHETAKAVVDAQQTVNSNMFRNIGATSLS